MADVPASAPHKAIAGGIKKVPTWIWIAAAGVLVFGYILTRGNSASAQTNTQNAGVDPNSPNQQGSQSYDPVASGGVSPTYGYDYTGGSLPSAQGPAYTDSHDTGGWQYSYNNTPTDSHNVSDSHDTSITNTNTTTDTFSPTATYSPDYSGSTGAGAVTTITNPITSTGGGAPTRPADVHQPPQPAPTLKPGWIMAPYGPKRPPNRAGYTVVGLGRGYWAYKPNPKPKPKASSKAR